MDTPPDQLPPYTNTKCGQAKYGGWTQEGVDAFLKWMGVVERARRYKKTRPIEEKALKIVQYVPFLLCLASFLCPS